MNTVGYMAIDQCGHYYGPLKHPRKDLLHLLGRQHAEKMYRDTKDDKIRHVGYVIGRLWLEVFRVGTWKDPE